MKTSASIIGAFEAKNTFSELLEQVGRGAEITITKHDRPVARLVPAKASGQKERKKATAELRVLRRRYRLKGLSVRELIDAGHHREALFQLLLVRTVAQGIIENDGGEEALTSSRIGYRRLLAALGIDGDEPFHARGQALRAFMPALREGCEALLARAPWLLD